MVVGFNHNFRYKGELYHIQTEDSGVKSANIITLLYRGGTILASQKTSYTDISKVENLAKVVEELMKEQHKEMLRRLKSGELDHLLPGVTPAKQVEVESVPQPEAQPALAKTEPVIPAAAEKEPATVETVAPEPTGKAQPEPANSADLEALVFAYLGGKKQG